MTKQHIILGCILQFFCASMLLSQENILQHNIHYSAHDQNMWGPDNAYGIDVEYTFFDININENWGITEITEIFGQEFGVGFQTGINAYLRSTYQAQGFHTGSFDIDYPVEITLDFPNHSTFNYGGPATIHTSYSVDEGWALTTEFPPVGVMTLDLEYEFNPFMDIIFCVFGCDTVNLIPSDVQIPHNTDTLFHLNGTPEDTYAVYPCWEGGTFQFCHDYDLPIEIDDWFDIGMTAFVTLPYVETEDYIDIENHCLIATGDSLYMNVNMDIFHFLDAAANLIPDPEGDNIQEALAFLADTINYPVETPLGDINAIIAYELIHADFQIVNHMVQTIEFCPTLFAKLAFPLNLPYKITDPENGDNLFEEGIEDTIHVPVGYDLTITYPCHEWDSMYIDVAYDISPTIRNHTRDSIAFVLSIEALSVSIELETPFKQSIAPATLPEFTLPEIQTNNHQTLSVSSPAVHSPGVSTGVDNQNAHLAKNIGPFEIGPLFSLEIPLGHADLTWFDETWELENFIQDTAFPGTYIKPRPKSELQLNLYSLPGTFCYGDSLNYIYAQVTDSLAPLSFMWSTGEIHNGIIETSDSLLVAPGYYSVTASDNYGCTTSDALSVQINPPIINSLEVEDILCHGENTGVIIASTIGGQSPFYYEWSHPYATNGMHHNTANHLPAGMHYVTITDWMGCSIIDSAYINQPPTALSITAVTNPVNCHDDSNGIIDIQISGANPPYTIEWANGFTGTHVENLPGGIYTVSVTDQNNCLLSEAIQVIQPDTLTAETSANMVDCYNASNGNIAIHTEGGTPPYTFQWFHNFNETADSISNLPPGLYVCSVTDAHGCEDTAIQYITQPDSLGLNINTGEPTCHGLSNGWIAVDPFGGIPPYTLTWDNFPNNLDSIPLLNTGNYPVTLTDAKGCNLIEPIYIDEPDNLSISFINVKHISCFGLEDGSVTALVQGGTEPYSYNWTAGINWNDSLVTNLDADITYQLSVIDNQDCEVHNEICLTEPEQLHISVDTEPVECGISGGSGHADAHGGTPPYNFLWSNGETTENAIELKGGEGSLILTDTNGCRDSIEFFVNRIGKLSAEVTIIQNVNCFGDSTGQAIANIPDGFTPFHFEWIHKGKLLSTKDTAMNLPAGNYTIFASDKYNCTDTAYIAITQADSINPNFEIIRPSCSYIADGQISTDPEGGTQPYYYKWSTGSVNSNIREITNGYYYLSITDFNDCLFDYEIELNEAEYCVIIHNTITPNGDGKNDVWIIENIEEFPFSKVWIFNRNGRQVFQQTAYHNNWDGTFAGKDLPEGTYYYLIDLGNGKEVHKGHLTIIR
jgi:gliding motility-associated-like protein